MDEQKNELRERSLELMAEGFAFLEKEEWGGAEGCFRAAGEMRDGMRWREEPEAAWMRGAAWINHGDAILRAGDVGRFPVAVESMKKCIEALDLLVLEESPEFLEQMVLAWIHKGTLYAEMNLDPKAERAFAEAEGLLRGYAGEKRTRQVQLAGMMLVNRARALLRSGQVRDAIEDARRGVEIFNAAPDAGAAVRARAVLCEALAEFLDYRDGEDEVEDWIAEATDAVEEAMAIMKETGLKEARAADLVRYGARIYGECQPMFLGEFLEEWLCGEGPLAGDVELREEMLGELLMAKKRVEQRVMRRPHETDFVKAQTVVIQKLQAGEAALKEG